MTIIISLYAHHRPLATHKRMHTIDIALFSRKIIEIPITDEEAYEKNVIMYVVIGDPRHIAGNDYLSVLYFLTVLRI